MHTLGAKALWKHAEALWKHAEDAGSTRKHAEALWTHAEVVTITTPLCIHSLCIDCVVYLVYCTLVVLMYGQCHVSKALCHRVSTYCIVSAHCIVSV
jgi:hypothetical protein